MWPRNGHRSLSTVEQYIDWNGLHAEFFSNNMSRGVQEPYQSKLGRRKSRNGLSCNIGCFALILNVWFNFPTFFVYTLSLHPSVRNLQGSGLQHRHCAMWPFSNVLRYDYLLSYLIVYIFTMNKFNFAAQPVAHCASIENVPSVPGMWEYCNPFTSQLRGISSSRVRGVFCHHCLGLVLLYPVVCVHFFFYFITFRITSILNHLSTYLPKFYVYVYNKFMSSHWAGKLPIRTLTPTMEILCRILCRIGDGRKKHRTTHVVNTSSRRRREGEVQAHQYTQDTSTQ